MENLLNITRSKEINILLFIVFLYGSLKFIFSIFKLYNLKRKHDCFLYSQDVNTFLHVTFRLELFYLNDSYSATVAT